MDFHLSYPSNPQIPTDRMGVMEMQLRNGAAEQGDEGHSPHEPPWPRQNSLAKNPVAKKKNSGKNNLVLPGEEGTTGSHGSREPCEHGAHICSRQLPDQTVKKLLENQICRCVLSICT